MKILKIAVDWMLEWSNNPSLKVLVDKLPAHEQHVYEERNGIYYSELEGGLVSFNYWKQPGEGYGGRVFTFRMKDDTERKLKGPWSSNSAAVNRQGFGPCFEVAITDDPLVWERGYTFFASAMTVATLQRALAEIIPGVVQLMARGDGGYLVHSIHGCYKKEHNKSRYDCPLCGKLPIPRPGFSEASSEQNDVIQS